MKKESLILVCLALAPISSPLSAAFAGGSLAVAAEPDPQGFEKGMEAYLQKDENVEKIGNALENYFRKKKGQQEEQAAKQEQDRMEEQFKNPTKVDIGTSPVRGNPDAKVTLIEFSDFQCPYCGRGATVVEDIMKAYPNDVKVVFKNLPLPFHPEARPAASAAIAAGNQGKFWEYYDVLFKNQGSLGSDFYVKTAQDLGLDLEKFKADMADPKTGKIIEADSAVATQLGINGTPGFVVNGVQVTGAQPFPVFKGIIDRWLKQKS